MARQETPPKARGVRRRRDDASAATFELEELDSEVMRQNSYNYFQRHSFQPNAVNGGYTTSRKRQRTLAEQLEALCLQGSARNARNSSGSSESRGESASSWWREPPTSVERVGVGEIGDDDVEMDTGSMNGSGSPSDGVEADLELDADDDSDGENSEAARLKVFGGVPDVKDMFFGSSSGRQRPMERIFRHYVTMAAERTTRSEPNSPRGDEIVLFRPHPTQFEFPYSLFTPEQIEDLRARHNRRKKRQTLAQERVAKLQGDQSWRFQEIDSSDEADVSSSAEDSDMDTSLDGEGREPHLAGSLSHGEWFLDEDTS
ncbi:hypothetical protein Poli38472_003014 [Pythium oligandrum]|uniref:Uncharacterized protein n=1 Tax=Pythium oligandrum TaxID=41045 RepID=A0A8K1FDN2_PYTOL|nr:hypothetical protein Poli38472_003014 [Pythium oligandrum]|eukprot:TMW57089.1 hypothetical protein Poli38472_003014 [Pythium oligandrum]